MNNTSYSNRVALAMSLFEAFAAGDLDRWEARLAPDFAFSYPGVPDGHGAAAARAYNQPFADACSDWKIDVHNTAENGDTVFIEMTIYATQTGPLVSPEGTLPASGNRGGVKAVLIADIRDGLIHREASYWNVPDLVVQIAPAAA